MTWNVVQQLVKAELGITSDVGAACVLLLLPLPLLGAVGRAIFS